MAFASDVFQQYDISRFEAPDFTVAHFSFDLPGNLDPELHPRSGMPIANQPGGLEMNTI
jgi:hypothetical protein